MNSSGSFGSGIRGDNSRGDSPRRDRRACRVWQLPGDQIKIDNLFR